MATNPARFRFGTLGIEDTQNPIPRGLIRRPPMAPSVPTPPPAAGPVPKPSGFSWPPPKTATLETPGLLSRAKAAMPGLPSVGARATGAMAVGRSVLTAGPAAVAAWDAFGRVARPYITEAIGKTADDAQGMPEFESKVERVPFNALATDNAHERKMHGAFSAKFADPSFASQWWSKAAEKGFKPLTGDVSKPPTFEQYLTLKRARQNEIVGRDMNLDRKDISPEAMASERGGYWERVHDDQMRTIGRGADSVGTAIADGFEQGGVLGAITGGSGAIFSPGFNTLGKGLFGSRGMAALRGELPDNAKPSAVPASPAASTSRSSRSVLYPTSRYEDRPQRTQTPAAAASSAPSEPNIFTETDAQRGARAQRQQEDMIVNRAANGSNDTGVQRTAGLIRDERARQAGMKMFADVERGKLQVMEKAAQFAADGDKATAQAIAQHAQATIAQARDKATVDRMSSALKAYEDRLKTVTENSFTTDKRGRKQPIALTPQQKTDLYREVMTMYGFAKEQQQPAVAPAG